MAKCFTEWTVLPHEPPGEPAENLWTVEGVMPDGRTHRRMVVARRADGDLVIHNAIALEEEHMKALEAFGRPKILVVPGAFHRQDARIWKDRYPELQVVCPAGSRSRIEKIVHVDGSYADAPPDPDVVLHHFDGCKEREGYLQVRSDDGVTIVINDMIMNMPKLPGVMGLLLGPTGTTAVPRVVKWIVVAEKAAFRAHLERLAALPDLKRVIVSHGRDLSDPPAQLRLAASRLA